MRAWAWFTACQDNTDCERLSSSRPSRLALRLRSVTSKEAFFFFFLYPLDIQGHRYVSQHALREKQVSTCDGSRCTKMHPQVSSPPEPHLFGRQRRAECFGWNPAKMQAIDKIQACPPAVSKWEQYFPHAPPDVWAHLFLPCHWGHHLAETAPHTALI